MALIEHQKAILRSTQSRSRTLAYTHTLVHMLKVWVTRAIDAYTLSTAGRPFVSLHFIWHTATRTYICMYVCLCEYISVCLEIKTEFHLKFSNRQLLHLKGNHKSH